jgi:hypothetical protein
MGERVEHSASNEYAKRGVSPGDVLYIVHYENRSVFLGARLVVDRLASQRQVERHFGSPAWRARDHVARRDEAETLNGNRLVPRKVLRGLRFRRADGIISRIAFDPDGAPNQQALRTVRRLTPESAAALDALM